MPALVARSPSFGPKWSFDDLEIELLSVPTTSNTHENTDASRVEPYDRLSTLPCPDIGANKLGNSLLEGAKLDYASASERDAVLTKIATNAGAHIEQMRLMSIKAEANGLCWCGCGEQVKAGKFFVPTHDRQAESMLLKIHYGTIANMGASHGYATSGQTLRRLFDDSNESNQAVRDPNVNIVVTSL